LWRRVHAGATSAFNHVEYPARGQVGAVGADRRRDRLGARTGTGRQRRLQRVRPRLDRRPEKGSPSETALRLLANWTGTPEPEASDAGLQPS
jgi:hypothetical protein